MTQARLGKPKESQGSFGQAYKLQCTGLLLKHPPDLALAKDAENKLSKTTCSDACSSQLHSCLPISPDTRPMLSTCRQ